MEANVPEKLYIISDEEGVVLSLDNATDLRGDRYDFVDEAVFPFEDGTFEYTRTDAFMKKAAEYLMDYEFNDSPTIADRRKRVENFKKYMKGE